MIYLISHLKADDFLNVIFFVSSKTGELLPSCDKTFTLHPVVFVTTQKQVCKVVSQNCKEILLPAC